MDISAAEHFFEFCDLKTGTIILHEAILYKAYFEHIIQVFVSKKILRFK